ncbi:hypothetical protein PGTUg99_000927 [Puccinia graminis f. sp. tritici]|uniref:Uncharacterized protein n=1 Tax=Puccinia graminis f. sp. tritici TaxID=56615 RepID=A0A5B0QYG4_PUCGR|nr:hypothetical protein PGTUg99_025152 [Puccinia graminis f. sp. tritici]KAA1118318.1 hypothetical protein PGTUg99_004466 [Puccinia graminis f. sp. tritici]KAA1129772.1 hypothetical protein PGTUg99_000927 [Puccinia graminis f. sp. tritici]
MIQTTLSLCFKAILSRPERDGGNLPARLRATASPRSCLYFSLIMKRTTCLLKRHVFLFYAYCQRHRQ